MNFETLKIRPEGDVLRVSLAAPPLNLMSAQMVGELFAVAGGLMSDQKTRVVVLDSDAEEFFIAHFDLLDMITAVTDPDSPRSAYPDVNVLQSLATTWQGVPQVTVAKVDGICRGAGLELILALDMRYASSTSTFCLPEAGGGFLASGGGTTRLLMACGPALALEFLLTARDFSGDEAASFGLVNRALPADELDSYVEDTVERIARRSPRIIAMHKHVVKSVFAPMIDSMFAGFRAENDGITASLGREDVLASAKAAAEQGQTVETERDLPGFLERLAKQTPVE